MILRISTWLLGISLIGCAKTNPPAPMILRADIVKRISLPQVHSASGLVVEDKQAWMIGDDSPWIYLTNLDGQIQERYLITTQDTSQDGRIPKPIKPDFEMLERVPETRLLLCMGSGSKRETRSAITLWHTERHEATLTGQFPDFMDQLASMLEGENVELNLEGAAFFKSDLVLLNRYPRALFTMDWAEIQQYWLGIADFPQISSVQYLDDPHQHAQVGFSGLTYFPHLSSLLFSASTEGTNNAYDDGKIGTSYLGLIQMNSDVPPLETMVPILENGTPLAVKVESVSIGKAIGADQWQVWAVTDADGGLSELLEIWITFKN